MIRVKGQTAIEIIKKYLAKAMEEGMEAVEQEIRATFEEGRADSLVWAVRVYASK